MTSISPVSAPAMAGIMGFEPFKAIHQIIIAEAISNRNKSRVLSIVPDKVISW
jgi:hypothetical protein